MLRMQVETAVASQVLDRAPEVSYINVSPWKAVFTFSSHPPRLGGFSSFLPQFKGTATLAFPCCVGHHHTFLHFWFMVTCCLKHQSSPFLSHNNALPPKLPCASQVHFQDREESWWRFLCPSHTFSQGTLCAKALRFLRTGDQIVVVKKKAQSMAWGAGGGGRG
jgi:hypothetical protein